MRKDRNVDQDDEKNESSKTWERDKSRAQQEEEKNERTDQWERDKSDSGA